MLATPVRPRSPTGQNCGVRKRIVGLATLVALLAIVLFGVPLATLVSTYPRRRAAAELERIADVAAVASRQLAEANRSAMPNENEPRWGSTTRPAAGLRRRPTRG